MSYFSRFRELLVTIASMNQSHPSIEQPKRDTLVNLFRQAATDHHQAFLASDGADPEWPMWYAEYMHDRLMQILNLTFTRSQLIYWLVRADQEHRQSNPDSDWSGYYADLILKWVASET